MDKVTVDGDRLGLLRPRPAMATGSSGPDGGVFAFGDAHTTAPRPPTRLWVKPVVGIALDESKENFGAAAEVCLLSSRAMPTTGLTHEGIGGRGAVVLGVPEGEYPAVGSRTSQ